MSDTTTMERGQRKIREGVVVSDRMHKTVIVLVAELRAHPLYRKVLRRTSRFKVHDEHNTCAIGDRVRIAETRPVSKSKCWRVVEVVEKAK